MGRRWAAPWQSPAGLVPCTGQAPVQVTTSTSASLWAEWGNPLGRTQGTPSPHCPPPQLQPPPVQPPSCNLLQCCYLKLFMALTGVVW